jgi:hypothetical protein
VNPLIILVFLVVAVFSWSLVSCLRAGEFKFGNGSYGRTNARVRRDDNPFAFWLLAVLQAGITLYIASFAIEM